MLIKSVVLKTLVGLFFFNLAFAQAGANKSESKPKSQDPNTQSEGSVVAPVAGPTALSFLEWKSARVHEAQQKVEQINKSQGQTQVFQEGKSGIESPPTIDEQKLNFNVDVALQLNVQDYFSMYLKNLSPDEFKEATKKMNSDEVAELLLAYKNSLEKEKQLPLKFSKNPKDNAKSKNPKI